MAGDNNTPDAPSAAGAGPKLVKGRPRGKPWPKGVSANPAGRPVGALNKATTDAKTFARELIDSPEYRSSLAARLKAGTAGPIEAMLWAYGHGKPVERVEQGGPGAFADVSTEELRERLAAAIAKLA